jgi:hypothetical protein
MGHPIRPTTSYPIIFSMSLQIRTREQAQQLVDRYIPNTQVQHQQLNHLDETLDELIP